MLTWVLKHFASGYITLWLKVIGIGALVAFIGFQQFQVTRAKAKAEKIQAELVVTRGNLREAVSENARLQGNISRLEGQYKEFEKESALAQARVAELQTTITGQYEVERKLNLQLRKLKEDAGNDKWLEQTVPGDIVSYLNGMHSSQPAPGLRRGYGA